MHDNPFATLSSNADEVKTAKGGLKSVRWSHLIQAAMARAHTAPGGWVHRWSTLAWVGKIPGLESV